MIICLVALYEPPLCWFLPKPDFGGNNRKPTKKVEASARFAADRIRADFTDAFEKNDFMLLPDLYLKALDVRYLSPYAAKLEADLRITMDALKVGLLHGRKDGNVVLLILGPFDEF